jgi:poly(3-hydroxybutyrate) depolymerase
VGTIDTAVLRETYRRTVLLLLAATLLAGCGSDEKSGLAEPFAYDSKPLALESAKTTLGSNGVEVRDISFAGPSKTRLDAYLAIPSSSGKHPAVVYAHGAGGDRLELLSEATEMARTGAVTLTLEMIYAPSRAKPLPPGMAGARENSRLEVEAVREVARAVDLLRSLPSVDGDRIGYVGWSAGARMGAIVSGVDHRIVAFDLIAGGGAPVSEYVRLAPADLRAELRAILDRTDSLRFVHDAAPSALLFQDGRRDEIVPETALRTLANAGSEPKEIRWYDSGHVPSAKAWSDSRTWLGDHLGLTEN